MVPCKQFDKVFTIFFDENYWDNYWCLMGHFQKLLKVVDVLDLDA